MSQGGLRYVLRNALLRPLYVLNRRGPLLPLVAVLVLTIYFVIYSTHPSSQSVKLRVQGAVGPYIPQRAANAIKWRGKQDAFLAGALVPVDVEEHDRVVRPPKVLDEGAVPPPTRRDGRVLIEEGKEHPILALMADARRKWATIKASQSHTFRQAVAEYVRRNGRRPPKGFDKWCVTSQLSGGHAGWGIAVARS